MKKLSQLSRLSRVPALAAAALALGLAGCGGDSVNSYLLGGTVTGLSSGTLVLSEGLSSLSIGSSNANYNFPARFPRGTAYSVYVVRQPTDLTCKIDNATGVIDQSDVTTINVTCVPNNRLGGTITGLNGTLQLANGNDVFTATPGTSSFFMPTKVGNGFSYGITVLTQPAGQKCTVQNGVGTMGTTDVTNVVVTCV